MAFSMVHSLRDWRVVLALATLVFLGPLHLVGCGGGGGASSEPASTVAPAITLPPASQSVLAGNSVTFSVTASGNGLTYQWQRSASGGAFIDIPGASNSIFTIAAVDVTMNGQQFRAVVQNAAGIVTSTPATLTVTSAATAPTITRHPVDQTALAPDSATFIVEFSGSPTPTIQWQGSIDGGTTWTNLSGANGSTYSTSQNFGTVQTKASVSGYLYRAQVTNNQGTATSNSAALRVAAQSLGGMPLALTIDTSNNLLAIVAPNYGTQFSAAITNRLAGLAQRIDTAGSVALLAGSTSQGFVNAIGAAAQFQDPTGIARDSAGNAYVADALNRVIRKITPDGTVSTYAGSGLQGFDDGPVASARFNGPVAVTVATDGTVFVLDNGNSRIRKISGGAVTTLALLLGASATGMTLDSVGNHYAVSAGAVLKVTPAGVVSTVGGTSGLTYPANDGAGVRFQGVALDNLGNLLATDPATCSIRKITLAGVATTLAGTGTNAGCGNQDGTGAAAKFSTQLGGIAVDTAGNAYVADGDNLCIRKITPTGVVTRFVR